MKISDMSEHNVLLSGIVGSTAYGLAGPDSDVDRLSMFAAPTVAFHGLREPTQTFVTVKPDVTYHEARKYVTLALAGNPTVMIRENLLRGLDRVAAHIEAGTLNVIAPGKSSPPSETGHITVALLQGLTDELARRRSLSEEVK